MESVQVTLRRALIGDALRRYRSAAGLTLGEAAAVLGCDRSKISRIETGQRGITRRELGELLAGYGAPDGERDVLLRLAQPGPPRWLGGDARVLPAALVEYLAAELAADELLIWAPCLVPDLLQVPDYARSVITADVTCADAHPAIRAALARRAPVSENRELVLDVVIGEAALCQQVAGPSVMTEQIRALAAAIEQSPAAAVRVLPFAAGEHSLAGCGPFTIARFRDAPAVAVVHLAGPAGGTCLTGPDTASRYLRAFEGGKSAAFSRPRSAEFLRDMARADR